MIHFHKRTEKYGKLLEQNRALEDDLYAVLVNANRLADAVIQNCDDWSEGRAFAYALRSSLRKYHDAKLHLNPKEAPK